MTDDSPMDPKENPAGTGHLPVSGELGAERMSHDPITADPSDGFDDG